jgi:hypothetical protein
MKLKKLTLNYMCSSVLRCFLLLNCLHFIESVPNFFESQNQASFYPTANSLSDTLKNLNNFIPQQQQSIASLGFVNPFSNVNPALFTNLVSPPQTRMIGNPFAGQSNQAIQMQLNPSQPHTFPHMLQSHFIQRQQQNQQQQQRFMSMQSKASPSSPTSDRRQFKVQAFIETNEQSKSDQNTCGYVKPTLSHYIARGQKTKHPRWPWYVQLIIAGNTAEDSETYCGGTIINSDYILTAAHCFDDLLPSKLAKNTIISLKGVILGDQQKLGRKRPSKKNKKQEISCKAESVQLHPSYVPAMSEYEAKLRGVTPGPCNDIAVVKIACDDEIKQRLTPACLPSEAYQLKPGTKCKIMGHGFINPEDEKNFIMPNELQMADVYISQNQACRDDVDSHSIKSKINSDTLCIRGPVHPCVGDSGGPLICLGNSDESIEGEADDLNEFNDQDFDGNNQLTHKVWYLMGVTSFAVSTDDNDRCGHFKSAVFSKVSTYLSWIHSVMANLK